jgi:hypothetical protein
MYYIVIHHVINVRLLLVSENRGGECRVTVAFQRDDEIPRGWVAVHVYRNIVPFTFSNNERHRRGWQRLIRNYRWIYSLGRSFSRLWPSSISRNAAAWERDTDAPPEEYDYCSNSRNVQDNVNIYTNKYIDLYKTSTHTIRCVKGLEGRSVVGGKHSGRKIVVFRLASASSSSRGASALCQQYSQK